MLIYRLEGLIPIKIGINPFLLCERNLKSLNLINIVNIMIYRHKGVKNFSKCN